MFARQKYDNKKDDIAVLGEKRTGHTTQHFNAKMCMFVGSQLSRKIGGADCFSALKCIRMIEKLESHLCSVSGQDITAVQKKKSYKVTGMTTTSAGLCSFLQRTENERKRYIGKYQKELNCASPKSCTAVAK